MPRLACNGYSLFAEQMKPSLEQKFDRTFDSFNELVRVASPFWEKLSEDDKLGWKERARTLKNADPNTSKKRQPQLGTKHNGFQLRNYRTRDPFKFGADRDENDSDVEHDVDDPDMDYPDELPGPVQVQQIQLIPGRGHVGLPSWSHAPGGPCRLTKSSSKVAPLKIRKLRPAGQVFVFDVVDGEEDAIIKLLLGMEQPK